MVFHGWLLMRLHAKVILIVLFKGAGQSQRSIALNTTISVYKKLMVRKLFICCLSRPSCRILRAKWWYLCVISSIAGLIGYPLRSGYSASERTLKVVRNAVNCSIQHSCFYHVRTNQYQYLKNALLGDGKQFGVKMKTMK
jgi:hypothetical protein